MGGERSVYRCSGQVGLPDRTPERASCPRDPPHQLCQEYVWYLGLRAIVCENSGTVPRPHEPVWERSVIVEILHEFPCRPSVPTEAVCEPAETRNAILPLVVYPFGENHELIGAN